MKHLYTTERVILSPPQDSSVGCCIFCTDRKSPTVAFRSTNPMRSFVVFLCGRCLAAMEALTEEFDKENMQLHNGTLLRYGGEEKLS